MDSKGQASAEYLLLILVILIIMGTVTIPLIGNSISSSSDVSKVSDAKTALTTIADAVNIVYSNGPGAKRTVNVYIPADGIITSDNAAKLIGMNIAVSNGTTKFVNASTSYNVTFSNPNVSGKKWYNMTVTWNPGNSFITVTPALS